MVLYETKKVVIITETLISRQVCEIIEKCGASGYTVVASGGKGSRNMRGDAEGASLVSDFRNVKVEVIVKNAQMAEAIVEKVAAEFFENYSGIAYLETVAILRPSKFSLEK